MATFKFELVSPERLVMSADVDQVDLPGTEGDFGVLAGHAPFVSTLKIGFAVVRGGDDLNRIYIRGGFADVTPETLTVLAEKAVPLADLTDEAIAAEIAFAENELARAATPAATETASAMLAAVKATLAPAKAA